MKIHTQAKYRIPVSLVFATLQGLFLVRVIMCGAETRGKEKQERGEQRNSRSKCKNKRMEGIRLDIDLNRRRNFFTSKMYSII